MSDPEAAASEAADVELHTRHSVLRERIVEHVFIGEMLRWLWQRGITGVEVLRSEFDAGGYDLVPTYGPIVRHIQFKTGLEGGKASEVTISLRLLEKPSGCAIWILVDPDLNFTSFLWFGGPPGQKLPDVRDLPVARHTKGNAQGLKAERPDHRRLKRNRFEKLESMDLLLGRLFEPLPA